ncbi:MAG: helix-turn-helix transcriptional regulator [Sphingobacterium sp.]|jgi:DNA-binding CsgD family transcriptional regulator|nr:helix-turn-helix transcriptional regulator [Sphingobacterium sp.]
MQIGCTEVSPITLGVIIIEFIFLGAHGVYYLERPSDKERLGCIFFVIILLTFNIVNIHLPDPFLDIPLYLQYVLRNGIGFTAITYFPYKFFRNKQITSDNLNGKRKLFLLTVPYPFLFILIFSFFRDLEITHKLTLFIPGINNLITVVMIGKTIFKYPITNQIRNNLPKEILILSTMIFWLFLYPAEGLSWGKATLTIFFNIGPTVLNGFLLFNWIKMRRIEQIHLRDLILLSTNNETVTLNCQIYMFSERETEVAVLLSHRLKRQQIADKLFISIRTVDKHIERIFLKTGVSSREQLFEKLNTIL